MQAMVDVEETYLNPLPVPANGVPKKRIRNRIPRRYRQVSEKNERLCVGKSGLGFDFALREACSLEASQKYICNARHTVTWSIWLCR